MEFAGKFGVDTDEPSANVFKDFKPIPIKKCR
jgi:hypothetical protein